MTKIGAIVVAYNPDDNIVSLSETLGSMLGVGKIIIVNNSIAPAESLEELKRKGYTIWSMNGNLGIAAALNSGAGCLISKECDAFFCFDQDSRINAKFVEDMIESWYKIKDKGAAMLCPTFFDINSNTQAKFTKIDGWRVRNFEVSGNERGDNKFIETSFAISSGSLVSMSAFIKVGGFDESFFIDHVDSEFCLRLIDNKYKILIDPNIKFFHSVGKRTKEKFLFLTIKPNNHSPIRRYYIFRNGIVTQSRYYKNHPGFILLNFARNIHEILSVIVFEDNKMDKLQAMLIGTYDGLNNAMGKNEKIWKKFSS